MPRIEGQESLSTRLDGGDGDGGVVHAPAGGSRVALVKKLPSVGHRHGDEEPNVSCKSSYATEGATRKGIGKRVITE